MWMGAEALLMFQKLVIVFMNVTWKYLLAVSIACWTLPILPIVITLALNQDVYIHVHSGRKFCFIGELIPFLVAFLLPILLIFIFNVVMYILIIRAIFLYTIDKNKRMGKPALTKYEAIKMLISYFGILILFGLTWLFAVFTFITEPNVSFMIQFFFAFFNTFQGFFIFLFFVLLNSDVRSNYVSLFRRWRSKKPPSTAVTTAAAKYNRTSSLNDKFNLIPHEPSHDEINPPNLCNDTSSDVANGSTKDASLKEEDIMHDGDKGFIDDDELMMSEFGSIRFQRYLSVRGKHYVEKIEVDL
uniref:G-protein coupled receptors family 2 profile 2 domain-containing protein n=1 Tax=Amphimedon queenslandica TaxID=400682 RepID=A0A1X7VDZ3_AMPQE